jgi:hypothetical protein
MSVGNVTSGINLDQIYSTGQVFQQQSEETEEPFSKPADWSKGKANVTPPADSKTSTKYTSLKEDELYQLLWKIAPFTKYIESIDEGMANTFEDRDSRNYQRVYSKFETSTLEKLLLNSRLMDKVLAKINLFLNRYHSISDKSEKVEISDNAKQYVENYMNYLSDTQKWFTTCLKVHKNEGQSRIDNDIITPIQTSSSSEAPKTNATTIASQTGPCLAYTRITKKWEQTLKQLQNTPSVGTLSM